MTTAEMWAESFRSICGSDLWDSHKFLRNYTTDFTPCFQSTVLLWTPCFFLWLCAPCWMYMLTRPRSYRIELSWLISLKSLIILALISVELANMFAAHAHSAHIVGYMTPMLLIVTYILAFFFIQYERLSGLRSSGLLFCFWAFLLLDLLIIVRSKVFLNSPKKSFRDSNEEFVFFFNVSLVVLMFILSCLKESIVVNDDYEKHKEYPENYSSFLSRVTFWWVNSFILKSFRNELSDSDYWKIDANESSALLTNRFEAKWKSRAEKFMKQVSFIMKAEKKSAAVLHKTTKLGEELALNHGYLDDEKLIKPTFIFCFFQVFYGKFIIAFLLNAVHELLVIVTPLFIGLIIAYLIDDEQISMFLGLFYTILLFIMLLLQSFIFEQYCHRYKQVGLRIQAVLTSLVYKKSLKLSNYVVKQTTIDQMSTLLINDPKSIGKSVYFLTFIIIAPIKVTICIFILWTYIGYSSIVGLLIACVLIIPINNFITNIHNNLRMRREKLTASRLKNLSDFFSTIKIIKINAVEMIYRRFINRLRKKELKVFKEMLNFEMISSFNWSLIPFFVLVFSFGVYGFVHEKEPDVKTIFIALAFFDILRSTLNFYPKAFHSVKMSNQALERLLYFLLSREFDNSMSSNLDGAQFKPEHLSIVMQNYSCGWMKNVPILKNLNIKIAKGTLVGVLGESGSGKNSFLSSIFGEMIKLGGSIHVYGRVAYVPGRPWIQNTSLEENVMFGRIYDEEKYLKVLDSCGLSKEEINVAQVKSESERQAFRNSEGEDMTANQEEEEIEVTNLLPEARKQLISLARAIYSNADIYIMDEPLSALESDEEDKIFQQVIGKNGLLKDKTRLLVTNSMKYLAQVDEIVFLENGYVSGVGSFDSLMQHSMSFRKFVRPYLKEEADFLSSTHYDAEKLSSMCQQLCKVKSNKVKQRSTLLRTLTNDQTLIDMKDSEENLQEKNEKIKWSYLVEYLKATNWKLFIFFFVFLLTKHIVDVMSYFMLALWTNHFDYQAKNQTHHFFTFHFILFVAFDLATYILQFSCDLMFVKIIIKTVKLYHRRLFNSMIRSCIEFFEKFKVQPIMDRFDRDMNSLENGIPSHLRSIFYYVFKIFVINLIISIITPYFLITIVPLIGVYILLERFFASFTRQTDYFLNQSTRKALEYYAETLRGMRVIRAFDNQDLLVARMQRILDNMFVKLHTHSAADRWLGIRVEIIGCLITLLATLFAVIAASRIDPAWGALSIVLSLRLSKCFYWLTKTTAKFESKLTAIKRIREYFYVPKEVSVTRSIEAMHNWPEKGHIQFVNFCARYSKDSNYVLKNINFEIMPGESIGIVGKRDSGKTTLALSLLKIYNSNSGSIFIDGVDINDIGVHDLRSKITFVSKDPILLYGTLRMNLDPNEIHSDKEIWEVLEKVNLSNLVSSLYKELLFEFDIGGKNLSVATRQLICLARAILKKSKIILFDDPIGSSEFIHKSIHTLFKNCTVIIVSRNLNSVSDCSKVMVLNEGKIIEFDRPESLRADPSSVFFSLTKMADQFSKSQST